MFKIDLRWAADKWVTKVVDLDVEHIVDAFIYTMPLVEMGLQGSKCSLLPISAGEFVIWAQGKCIGFLGIYPVDGFTDGG